MHPAISIAAAVLHVLDEGPHTTKELRELLTGLEPGYLPSANVIDQATSTLRRASHVESVIGTSQSGSPGLRGRPPRIHAITDLGRRKAAENRHSVAMFFGLPLPPEEGEGAEGAR
jgi:hypothetical protein